jgi:hypothetical protein
MAGQLIPIDRGPSKIVLHRRSTLLDNAKQGLQPSFAVIGYKGRNWRLKFRSEETLLRDDRGQPLGSIEVVIVGVSPNISRQYFAKSYTEGDDEGPDCFSTNGEKPDAAAPRKQHEVCATCKWSAWGSRITDAGKRSKMCQDTRRLAVVPLIDIENETFGGPMLLRLPPMSLNNLGNYSDFLARKGASFEYVGTRIGFDYDVAYPRLTFEAIGFLSEEDQKLVIGEDGSGGVCADPMLMRMLFDNSNVGRSVEEEDTNSKVVPMARGGKQAASDPRQPPEEPEEPEEPAEPMGPPAPEPPPQPQEAKKPVNPFQQALKPQAPPEPVQEPAKAPRGKKVNRGSVMQPAPASLNEAVDNLLGDDAA